MTKRKQMRRTPRTRELTAYTGPVHLPTRDGLDNRTTRLNLSISTTAGSGVTGEISGYFTTDVTSTTDWSSVSSVYQEYRVLAMEVRYIPLYTVPVAGGNLPAVGAMDYVHYNGATAPTSLDQVLQNANHKVWHTHKPLAMHWKMRGTEEASWTYTGAAVDHGSIRWFVNGASASVNYGKFVITYLVECRGRR